MYKMKLIIMSSLLSFLFLATNINANACTSDEITIGSTISDDWTADCNSTHRTDTYAKYYTFTLDDPKTVVINLNSEVDTYLYLLPDTNQSSNPINENDDYNGQDSQISMDLDAGTYTIEATTSSMEQTGSFTLSLDALKITEFKGEVTLPESITDLLDSCSGEECPSINVNVHTEDYNYGGTSVDYNGSAYVYQFTMMSAPGVDIDYKMEMYIENGDMGSESFVYSFGSDNQVGGTDDAADVMYHRDELWNGETSIVVEPLLVAANTESVIVDLDFTNKNEGRQKVTGKVMLPSDINMSEIVENTEYGYSYYKNSIDVSIQGDNNWLWMEIDRIADAEGYYTFISSIPSNLPTSSKLSLGIYGTLYDSSVHAAYQIYTDENDLDDHKIDGDEKFVSGWLNSDENYVDFNETVADFGLMDMAAYLDGYEMLIGSVIAPGDLFDKAGVDGISSIGLELYNNSFYSHSYITLYDYNESTPPEYSVLIPGSEIDAIKQEGLQFRMGFYWENYNANIYASFTSYYSFGTDNDVGGTGDDLDHLLEGCIDPLDAMPLIVDPVNQFPVVDLNVSDYILPNISKAVGTLDVPSGVADLYLWTTDTTCGNLENWNGWAWDNGNGTWSYNLNGLLESHDYVINVSYRDASNAETWYRYVLNDEDLDLTTDGVYLDEITVDEFGEITYPDPLAVVTGAEGTDIVISPFEFILPPKTEVSPALIMYLLN